MQIHQRPDPPNQIQHRSDPTQDRSNTDQIQLNADPKQTQTGSNTEQTQHRTDPIQSRSNAERIQTRSNTMQIQHISDPNQIRHRTNPTQSGPNTDQTPDQIHRRSRSRCHHNHRNWSCCASAASPDSASASPDAPATQNGVTATTLPPSSAPELRSGYWAIHTPVHAPAPHAPNIRTVIVQKISYCLTHRGYTTARQHVHTMKSWTAHTILLA
jgi:hypothetical protein